MMVLDHLMIPNRGRIVNHGPLHDIEARMIDINGYGKFIQLNETTHT